MHTPTRSACRPLSSLALMAALGAQIGRAHV